MKRSAIAEFVLFVALFAGGVGLRIWLQHLPNFAPVAAISLFAGYFFRSWLVAACLPIAIMGVSDQVIGGYHGGMMLLVHATLALPVLCRGFLRSRPVGSARSNTHFFAAVFASSLAFSCLFFLITNFGSWLWEDMYEHNFAGLVQCYFKALPFFRPTLAGDFVYSAVLFGSYATMVSRGLVADRSLAPAASVS